MPYLDELFGAKGAAPFHGSQVWEAQVVAVKSDGAYVILPRYSASLRWGPLMPASLGVKVGDRIAVALSDAGVCWAVGAGDGGGGGGGDGGGNIDGGFPDSIYGGTPLVDGNGVTR